MYIKLNQPAFDKAKAMIKRGFEVGTDAKNREAVKPSTDEKLNYLKNHTLEEYGLWFLGINTDLPDNDQNKYTYPYGDFNLVQEGALIEIKEMATKSLDNQIIEAVNKLLEILYDQKKLNKT
ncbi:hypothetical protein GF385_03805 [Candidatus Dependentiae bacterium]|nr:hypothetical protein [Candidatus Dependentiae bacterium]